MNRELNYSPENPMRAGMYGAIRWMGLRLVWTDIFTRQVNYPLDNHGARCYTMFTFEVNEVII